MASPFSVSRVYRGSPHLPVGRNAITGFVAGNDLDVRLPVKIGQAGQTILRGVFTVKNSAGVIVVQKIVTTTLSASGQVTDSGADGLGEVLFLLTPTQTALFTSTYTFDAIVVLANGDVQTIESGIILFTEKVTSDPANISSIDHIDVTPNPLNLILSGTQQMTATPKDAANVSLTGRAVDWFVSDSSILSIDENGLLTALAEGSAKVGAAAEGVVGVADVVVSVDDIGVLVGNMGGDASLDHLFDGRFNVRHLSNAVYAVEDARIPSGDASGRLLFPGNTAQLTGVPSSPFNAATRASWLVWGQCLHKPTDGGDPSEVEVWRQGAPGGGNEHFVLTYNGSGGNTEIRALFSLSLGPTATFSLLGATYLKPGTPFLMAWVYDGTLGSNADRLKLYTSVYQRATDTWSALVQQTLTFAGTIPAQLGTAAGEGVVNNGSTGPFILDEVRTWVGTALTSSQVAQETLSAAPALPNFRYTFNGNLNNSGSTAGFNLANGATAPITLSSVYKYPILTFAPGTPLATYDPVNFTITQDGVDDSGLIQGPRLSTGDHYQVYVGVLPGFSAAEEYVMQSYRGNGETALKTSLTSATAIGVTAAATATVNPSGLTGRRVLHARRRNVAGTVTSGARIGTAAEVTAAAAGGDTEPWFASLGSQTHYATGTLRADLTWRAHLQGVGDYTGAKQTLVNDWAQLRHGAAA